MANSDIPLKERLIVALDVPTIEEADSLVETLDDSVEFYKIGMQLQFAGGLDYARALVDRGKKVFLDAKLFDIDKTIELAVANVARMGVNFLTVHGNGKTIRAAVAGRGDAPLKVFAVTVLTSLDNADLSDMFGREMEVQDLVFHRAQEAVKAGADGVIASGHEAALIRELADAELKVIDVSDPAQDRGFRIITPGIRPSGADVGDQKRVMTPERAIGAGADHLVVGRPITKANDPRAVADSIVAEIDSAL